jgi:SAM-dependent methyltransferase
MKRTLVKLLHRVVDNLQADPRQGLAFNTRIPLATVAPVINHVTPTSQVDLSAAPLARTLEAYMAGDPLPLPATANREGYHGDRHYDYWRSGLKEYLQIKAVLARQGIPFDRVQSMLELGCATGRVLRHFVCQEPQLTVWGADIHISHIEWILQHLGPTPKVFQNSLLPHLPLEDNSLDLVCAFSVFTHIDEFELAWLAEVRRILKPGGIAYLTLHTDHTWGIMNRQHALYNHLLHVKAHILEYDVSPALFAQPMPAQRIAFRWAIDGIRRTNVFHSEAYLQATWGRFFSILDLIHEGSDYQDVVLLQK